MKKFECTCSIPGRPLGSTEILTAEIMGVDPQELHNFMDNWESAVDVAWDEVGD
jgi:hypothetical protein